MTKPIPYTQIFVLVLLPCLAFAEKSNPCTESVNQSIYTIRAEKPIQTSTLPVISGKKLEYSVGLFMQDREEQSQKLKDVILVLDYNMEIPGFMVFDKQGKAYCSRNGSLLDFPHHYSYRALTLDHKIITAGIPPSDPIRPGQSIRKLVSNNISQDPLDELKTEDIVLECYRTQNEVGGESYTIRVNASPKVLNAYRKDIIDMIQMAYDNLEILPIPETKKDAKEVNNGQPSGESGTMAGKSSTKEFFRKTISSQQNPDFQRYETMNMERRYEERIRVAFYNVENLFDLENDPDKRDDDFTPEGENRYTYARYKKKSDGLAKTMLAMGGWEPVEFIGLCEVENKWVLEGLTKRSPMNDVGYEIIHEHSPDFRGIDVAAIYRPDKFKLINYKYYRVTFPHAPERTTRDLLYVKGQVPNGDTLHIFVNHWPSRYGGQFASEPGRIHVANMVRQKVDSLNARFNYPYIAIIGDFNDYPNDISILEHLRARKSVEGTKPGDLINLSYRIMNKFGTHSFQGEWGVLDQCIVSHTFFTDGSMRIDPSDVGVFDAPWLITLNAAGGTTTFRTFMGPAYKGGYSDHLPTFFDIHLGKYHRYEKKLP